uniref:Protein kinase domain-containing protein n=1 Tax=Sander lucioperca TaxID=283035 RepID=A0A8C9ZCT4_SANLU
MPRRYGTVRRYSLRFILFTRNISTSSRTPLRSPNSRKECGFWVLSGTVIGQGAYGTVYKATCQKTGKEFALKCHKRGVEEATVRELSCLTALQGHPYVIQIHECVIHNGMMATLMSYAPYTLSNVIHSGHLLFQVAEALSYMHRLNLVHRDLTPFNVLLTEDLTVQVADMGLSRHSCKWMSTPVVTEAYRAPELFVEGGISEYTCAIDMWSLGVMIVDTKTRRCTMKTQTPGTKDLVTRTLCFLQTERLTRMTLFPTETRKSLIVQTQILMPLFVIVTKTRLHIGAAMV